MDGMREMTGRDWLEMMCDVAKMEQRREVMMPRIPRPPVRYESPWERARKEREKEAKRLARIAKLKPERAKNRARRKARRASH